jgi:hypothetical protein
MIIYRDNTRKKNRIDQLSIRIQLIEGLFVKYANAEKHKVLARHSSGKTLPSSRKKFYKQDSTKCEDIKTTEMVWCVSKIVYWCDVGVCMECFRN